MTVTFESLPMAVMELNNKVDRLLALQTNTERKEEDNLFTIEQLCDYLPEHPARQTVYGWVNYRLIPYEKHGKRLYFRKSSISNWLSNGRK
jgi:hypothetical protein